MLDTSHIGSPSYSHFVPASPHKMRVRWRTAYVGCEFIKIFATNGRLAVMLGSVRFVSKESLATGTTQNNEARGSSSEKRDDVEDAGRRRREAGLDWMTMAPSRPMVQEAAPELDVAASTEKPYSNPRELNPYWKAGAEGFPSDEKRDSSAISSRAPRGVGDGGASWRLKALKRAQEQASREGTKLDEVIGDRWGSLSTLTSGITGKRAAHANAHLHAIWDRKRQAENVTGTENTDVQEDNASETPRERDGIQKRRSRDEFHNSRMKAPRIEDSLKWRNRGRNERQQMRPEDAAILRTAAASYNKYENDGSFLQKFNGQLPNSSRTGGTTVRAEKEGNSGVQGSSNETEETRPRTGNEGKDAMRPGRNADNEVVTANSLDPNQIAAKVMRLRLMGKVKEADELLKEAETGVGVGRSDHPKDNQRSGSETVLRKITAKQKYVAEHKDSDMVLASKIARNRERFQADDEYDYDHVGQEPEAQMRRSAKKEVTRARNATASQFNRIQLQHERCQFCFENPSRPKHLAIAIANFTYLMLPPKSPLVPGHCYILPMQHEGSTRNVDDDVWEELRNFKKCLIKMFREQDKEAIFMETVMGLSQQRRHCLVECIPVPSNVIKQAPLYFKKAIDEAEDEWSQHNAKKLIDTRGKGLRASIPKNFPYFHVEFGLEGGYCHVIDDETTFKSQFGRDVLIGMLKLPQEGMYQKSKYDAPEQQRAVVREFSQQWKPHDWTKMLD